MDILLIGSGNVATHLFLQWQKNTDHNIYLMSRTKPEESWSKIKKYFSNFDDLKEKHFDWTVIAVNDDAITEICAKTISTEVIIHTSGSVGLEPFTEGNYRNYGVFYPLQTFTKTRSLDMTDVPFFIEGNNEFTLSFLKERAMELGVDVHQISQEEKKKLHLAAVFVSNYTNYLRVIGKRLVGEEHFKFLQPLMKETLQKSLDMGPEKAQTGPAKRKDLKTIQQHALLLEGEEKKLYELMAQMIVNDEKL